MLKLGMVSSFHPHSMCTKLVRVTTRTTSCTNWTISFEVWGVSDENSSILKILKLDHHFTNIACVQQMRGLRQKLDGLRVQTGPSPSKYDGFQTKTHLLWKGWDLAWYDHFTNKACVQKLRGYDKNWMHFVYKLDHLLRSMKVSRKLICYRGILFL